jgi:hypothetical protein
MDAAYPATDSTTPRSLRLLNPGAPATQDIRKGPELMS